MSAAVMGPTEIERTRAQLSRPTFRANVPATGLVADDLLATVDALRGALTEAVTLAHDEGPGFAHTPYGSFESCPNDLCRKAALALDPENDGNILLRTLAPGEVL